MSTSQKVFDTYGISNGDLKHAADFLEQKLGIKFVLRESSFRGGDYCNFKDPSGGELLLQLNFVRSESEDWEQPEHKDFPLILYVNDNPRFQEVQNLIEDGSHIKLIKRASL